MYVVGTYLLRFYIRIDDIFTNNIIMIDLRFELMMGRSTKYNNILRALEFKKCIKM